MANVIHWSVRIMEWLIGGVPVGPANPMPVGGAISEIPQGCLPVFADGAFAAGPGAGDGVAIALTNIPVAAGSQYWLEVYNPTMELVRINRNNGGLDVTGLPRVASGATRVSGPWFQSDGPPLLYAAAGPTLVEYALWRKKIEGP